MKFDYPISKIEIHPQTDGVQVFVERKQQFTNPDTGEIHVLNTWRSPIPFEELNQIEQFLSRDGATLSETDLTFIAEKLKPALEALGIQPSPDSGIEGEINI